MKNFKNKEVQISKNDGNVSVVLWLYKRPQYPFGLWFSHQSFKYSLRDLKLKLKFISATKTLKTYKLV
jgi:hypothetical protein